MNFHLTKTEQDILDLLWLEKKWLSGAEFWEYFNQHGKPCKRQTVNTYLSRMTDKGLLIKYGKKYMYAFTKEEFEKKKATEILDSMYNGHIKNFVAALGGLDELSSEDITELKEYLNEMDTQET